MSEIEPNGDTVAQLGEALKAAQAGVIQGIICVAFLANGDINVMVRGNESLVVRLGSLTIAADGIKLVEGQKQKELEQARKRQSIWAPGGNA